MNRSSRGFTMIELMVTVAIVAVLAAVAGPNLSEFIDRQRLVGQTQAIAAMAQTARSEVIKRRANTAGGDRRVAMTINPGADWYIGLANGNAACTTEATCKLNIGAAADDGVTFTQWLSKANAGSCPTCTMAEPAEQIVLIFDHQGLVTNVGAGAETAITLESPKGKQLRVRISRLGRVSLCSVGGTVTGYQSCPV